MLIASTFDAVDNECQAVSGEGNQFALQAPPSAAWSQRGRRVLLLQVAAEFGDVAGENDTSDYGETGYWNVAAIDQPTTGSANIG